MICYHERCSLVVEIFASHFRHLIFALEQRIGSRQPQSKDKLGLDKPDLLMKVRLALVYFLPFGDTIIWRATLYDIGNVDIGAA